MKNVAFIDHEEYIRVEDKDDNCIRVFTNINKLEKEMLEKAPEDKELIIEFANAVRKFLKLHIHIEKAPEIFSLLDGLKMIFKFIPYIRAFKKWSSISIQEHAEKCKNNLLKKTFESIFLPKMIALFSNVTDFT